MPEPSMHPAPTVIIQPDEGNTPILRLMASAERSLRIKQFSFTDPVLIAALIEAHGRGVAVQVMLNPQRSSGTRANDETFAALEAAGVPVRWTNPRFAVTHEKSILVDGRLAVIATFNLCEKYFTQTRDYGLVIHDPDHLAQINACFEADWEQGEFEPEEGSGLLWSADNSRRLMAHFIDSATEKLFVQHPKFVDATILERLAAARGRGVKIHLLCGGKHGISEWDILDTFSSLRILHQLGVKVRRQKHLKLHAKLLIADGKRALVGSMNIDRSAFDLRRELGLTFTDADCIERLSECFESDWQLAKHYEAPDPLIPAHHDEGELPHDPGFLHE